MCFSCSNMRPHLIACIGDRLHQLGGHTQGPGESIITVTGEWPLGRGTSSGIWSKPTSSRSAGGRITNVGAEAWVAEDVLLARLVFAVAEANRKGTVHGRGEPLLKPPVIGAFVLPWLANNDIVIGKGLSDLPAA